MGTSNSVALVLIKEMFLNRNAKLSDHLPSSQSSKFKYLVKLLSFEHSKALAFSDPCGCVSKAWNKHITSNLCAANGSAHSPVSYLSRKTVQLHYKMKVNKICNMHGKDSLPEQKAIMLGKKM